MAVFQLSSCNCHFFHLLHWFFFVPEIICALLELTNIFIFKLGGFITFKSLQVLGFYNHLYFCIKKAILLKWSQNHFLFTCNTLLDFCCRRLNLVWNSGLNLMTCRRTTWKWWSTLLNFLDWSKSIQLSSVSISVSSTPTVK